MNNKFILFLVVVLLLGGALFLVKNQKKETSMTKTVQVSPTVEVKKETGVMEKEKTDMESESATVSVTASGFEPKTITVKAGTKVVWKNDTDVTTNVSSANHPTHLIYPPLNLGNFEPGDTVSLVFDTAGSYKYHDHLNPSRTGVVVVE